MRVTARNLRHQPRRDMTVLQAMTAALISVASIAVEAASFRGLGDLPGGFFSSQAANVSADGAVAVGIGTIAAGSGQEGFRWTQSGGMAGLGDLPGGNVFSRARAVSADGDVVVGISVSDSGSEAFRWTQSGGMAGLGDLPGGSFGSVANGVSADGSVIVGGGNTASGATAFYWTESGGMQNLKDLLVSSFGLDLTGWTLTAASGVSADGLVVVGSGLNPLGQGEAWMADLRPVPAPATVWLLGSALIWLRTFGRRRSTGSFR